MTPTIYYYTLFLKELDYRGLLIYGRKPSKIEATLKMLANHQVCVKRFILGPSNHKRPYYEIWTLPCYATMFNTLNYVDILQVFPKNKVMQTLSNCTKLVCIT